MSILLADRVQETTATTGTGTITLAGPVAAYQSFAAGVGVGASTYYCLLSGDGVSWEVGEGTVGGSAGAYTLARTTVIDGSNGTSPISLTGTSVVFVTLPASKISSSSSSSSGYTRPALSEFTWGNQVNATAIDNPNGPLTVYAYGTSADSIQMLYKAAPTSTAWTWTVRLSHFSVNESYDVLGIWLRCASTGKIVNMQFCQNSIAVQNWISYTSHDSTVVSFGCEVNSPLWFRVATDGTNMYFLISSDGWDWVQVASTTLTYYLATIDEIGFGVDLNTSATMKKTISLWDWEVLSTYSPLVAASCPDGLPVTVS